MNVEISLSELNILFSTQPLNDGRKFKSTSIAVDRLWHIGWIEVQVFVFGQTLNRLRYVSIDVFLFLYVICASSIHAREVHNHRWFVNLARYSWSSLLVDQTAAERTLYKCLKVGKPFSAATCKTCYDPHNAWEHTTIERSTAERGESDQNTLFVFKNQQINLIR